MLKPKLFDDLAAKVSALIAATPAKDVEKNLRALLTGALGRLDLVTREEFDIQREALALARAQLVALETKVAELEGRAGHGARGN
jgi:ubiquinone biosynthesis accessory factor UbiK